MSDGRNHTRLEPVRKSVTVGLPVDEAFRHFTEGMSGWWPLATHSVGGEEAEAVRFEGREGGKIVERLRGGGTAEWGTVLLYDPPNRVVFTWHPGRDPDSSQRVEVRFIAVPAGTRVELSHDGWEAFGDRAEEMRSQYDAGWEFVLGRYTGGGRT